MMVQVSAAALASENKILASPASVDSIPTSSDKEDHVSMGTIAARKAVEIIENVKHILAMEILASSQGLYFLEPLKPGFDRKRKAACRSRKCIRYSSIILRTISANFPVQRTNHPERPRCFLILPQN